MQVYTDGDDPMILEEGDFAKRSIEISKRGSSMRGSVEKAQDIMDNS